MRCVGDLLHTYEGNGMDWGDWESCQMLCRTILGKEGGILTYSTILRKFSEEGGVPSSQSHLSEEFPVVPENEPALVGSIPAILSHWLGAAFWKHGLSMNVVMDFGARLGLEVRCAPKVRRHEAYSHVCYSLPFVPHRLPPLQNFKEERPCGFCGLLFLRGNSEGEGWLDQLCPVLAAVGLLAAFVLTLSFLQYPF